MIWVVHHGSGYRFLPIPDQGQKVTVYRIQGSERHRILDPGVRKAPDARSGSGTLRAHFCFILAFLFRWEWSREAHSLAAGSVVGNMSGPRLLLAGLLPGSYIFQLQVLLNLTSLLLQCCSNR
jgi:hypothetical protein